MAANFNDNPNARYDNGPNCAGSSPASTQQTLQSALPLSGLRSDGTTWASVTPRVGFSAAGVARNNSGPNVAGAPRSYRDTV